MSDYQWVLPRISVGAALQASDYDKLEEDKVGYVIDVTQHDDGGFLAEAVNHPGIDVLWVNTGDDGVSKKDLFKGLVAPWFIPRWFVEPAKHWNIHCDAGVNRGPSTTFFCLLLLGFSATDAEDFIRHARPQVGLAYKVDAMVAAEELGYLVR